MNTNYVLEPQRAKLVSRKSKLTKQEKTVSTTPKKYHISLFQNMEQKKGDHIGISYCSLIRTISPQILLTLSIRHGATVLQIRNFPAVNVLPTLHHIFKAIYLAAVYFSHVRDCVQEGTNPLDLETFCFQEIPRCQNSRNMPLLSMMDSLSRLTDLLFFCVLAGRVSVDYSSDLKTLMGQIVVTFGDFFQRYTSRFNQEA